MDDAMKRISREHLEPYFRLHKLANVNIIRNWVGQPGDEAFYDAADRNGVVVWQDFWLANPWDGPDPDDNDFFLANAKEASVINWPKELPAPALSLLRMAFLSIPPKPSHTSSGRRRHASLVCLCRFWRCR